MVGGKTTYFIGPNYEVEQPDALALTVQSSGAAGNGYSYRIFDDSTSYTIQSGDVLEFEITLICKDTEIAAAIDENREDG